MKKALAFLCRQDGVELMEYGLAAALIAVVAIAAMKLLGTNLTGLFESIANTLKVN